LAETYRAKGDIGRQPLRRMFFRKPDFQGKSQCQAYARKTLSDTASKIPNKRGQPNEAESVEKARFLRQKPMLSLYGRDALRYGLQNPEKREAAKRGREART
jgi:hypothetical protein